MSDEELTTALDQTDSERQVFEVAAISLVHAQLCVDCDTVYDQRRGACPCGSRASFPIARVIGGSAR